jgi:hypothetical protein
MSLLLTRHVNEYCVNIGHCPRGALGIYRLRAALLQPFADKAAVKTITLDHEHTLHSRTST